MFILSSMRPNWREREKILVSQPKNSIILLLPFITAVHRKRSSARPEAV
jgi:hypothetical protein